MLRRFMIAVRQGAADAAADPRTVVKAIMTARSKSSRDVLSVEFAVFAMALASSAFWG